ncbi:MAG: aminotransferase class IV [Pseudomonadota bacterium]
MNSPLELDNRGLAYGDGLFETCRVRRGLVPWLDRHLSRLKKGAEVLRLDWQSIHTGLQQELRDVLEQAPDSDWVKLIVTRTARGRGYAPTTTTAMRFWQTGPMKPATERVSIGGFVSRSGGDPVLAGLKHLSRLPDVLATGGPDEQGERLILDAQGRVVCATSSNVFFVVDGEVLTPRLISQGVRGVMAEWVSEQIDVRRCAIAHGMVSLASECFLTNALRGVISVSEIAKQPFSLDTPVANGLRSRLLKSSWA